MASLSPQEKRNITWLTGWGLFVILTLAAVNFVVIISVVERPVAAQTTRALASLESQPTASSPKTDVFDWDCLSPRQEQLTTSRSSLRFLLHNCLNPMGVKNLTNQSDGDLFPVSTELWTSDYVHLNGGSNKIQLTWEKGSQTLEVIRKNRSSNQAQKEL